MEFLVLSGNPKTDGLCDSVIREIVRGGEDAGARVSLLDTKEIERCAVCGDGWGICREQHRCVLGGDGFDLIQQAVRDADCICLVTPVYWWEMAEGLKCLLDRLRRCEFGQNGALSGKPVLLVASPGGTGNGMLPCLDQLDRFCRHTGAVVFDYIGINRWNCDYKRQTAYAAAKALAGGRQPGTTI